MQNSAKNHHEYICKDTHTYTHIHTHTYTHKQKKLGMKKGAESTH